MKKQLLLLTMMLLPMVAIAATVEIDGIWYNLVMESKQAEVTHNPNTNIMYTENVKIPASVSFKGNMFSVTSLGDEAFRGCSGLSSITIPNSVKSIGVRAFSVCTGLKSVHISDISAWCKISFADSEANPFYYAHHLYVNNEEVTELVIPNDVTSIRDYAFRNCSSLTSITIPNSVTSIGEFAFAGCNGLLSVNIPNSVTSIGICAFGSCNSLTSVTFPNRMTSISSWAFEECI